MCKQSLILLELWLCHSLSLGTDRSITTDIALSRQNINVKVMPSELGVAPGCGYISDCTYSKSWSGANKTVGHTGPFSYQPLTFVVGL